MKKTLLFFFATVFSFAQTVSLDTTFGNDGKVISTNSGSFISSAFQSDGKIIICRFTTYNSNGNLNLIRFNTDGSIDTTFGNNGLVSSPMFVEVYRYQTIKVLSDDSILLVGSLNGLAGSDTAVAKYTSNGTIDNNFGNNGYVQFDYLNRSDWGECIEIQNDGKIIVGSWANYGDIGISRLNTNGTIDSTFGTNGKFLYNIGTRAIPNASPNSADYIGYITTNSTGDIFVGGSTDAGKNSDNQDDFFVLKLNSTGIVDNTFVNNGLLIRDFGGLDNVTCMQFSSDNKLIVGGTNELYTSDNNSVGAKIAFFKIDIQGNYDSPFGANGSITLNRNTTSQYDFLSNFLILNDNSLLVAGYTPDDAFTNIEFLLLKLSVSGQVDTIFNTTGYSLTDFDGRNDYCFGVLLQNDGKIILSGGINNTNTWDGAMARFELSTMSTQNNNLANVSVYPNPFQDTITIKVEDITTLKNIALYDILGKSITINPVLNNENITINTENIQNGIYFLKYTQSGKTTTHKLIKTE